MVTAILRLDCNVTDRARKKVSDQEEENHGKNAVILYRLDRLATAKALSDRLINPVSVWTLFE